MLAELAAVSPAAGGRRTGRPPARSSPGPTTAPTTATATGTPCDEAAESPHCSANFCVHWVERPPTDAPDPDTTPATATGCPTSSRRRSRARRTPSTSRTATLGWDEPLTDGSRGGVGPGLTDVYLIETNGAYFGYASPDEGQGQARLEVRLPRPRRGHRGVRRRRADRARGAPGHHGPRVRPRPPVHLRLAGTSGRTSGCWSRSRPGWRSRSTRTSTTTCATSPAFARQHDRARSPRTPAALQDLRRGAVEPLPLGGTDGAGRDPRRLGGPRHGHACAPRRSAPTTRPRRRRRQPVRRARRRSYAEFAAASAEWRALPGTVPRRSRRSPTPPRSGRLAAGSGRAQRSRSTISPTAC